MLSIKKRGVATGVSNHCHCPSAPGEPGSMGRIGVSEKLEFKF